MTKSFIIHVNHCPFFTWKHHKMIAFVFVFSSLPLAQGQSPFDKSIFEQDSVSKVKLGFCSKWPEPGSSERRWSTAGGGRDDRINPVSRLCWEKQQLISHDFISRKSYLVRNCVFCLSLLQIYDSISFVEIELGWNVLMLTPGFMSFSSLLWNCV